MRGQLVIFFGLVTAMVLVLCAALTSCSNSNPEGTDGGMDVTQPAIGLTCSKLLFCDQACMSTDCTNGCYAEATGVAQGLFDTLNTCIDLQCPDAGGTCQQNAATGACGGNLASCFADTFVGPPDPDGGAVVYPDAGLVYNCGELNTCLAACAEDAGAGCAAACNSRATPQAEALEAALDSCLAIACPSTDGGPCQMQGPACAGCIEQVTLAQPDTCATPYIACNADTSNTDGGVAVPTVLADAGTLSTVLTGLDQAASTIIASNNWLYFTQVVGGGPVYRLWIGGGSAEFPDGGVGFGDGGIFTGDGGTILESVGPAQPTPVSLAVDANNVYVWSVGTFQINSSINNGDGTVVQIPIGGGAATTLATNMEVLYDAAYLNAIASDATHVYWVAGASGSDGAIMRSAIGGGGATAIYSSQQIPQAVVTDGTHVFWADWGTFDSMGHSNNDGTLWQGSVDGTATALKLASSQSAPSAIAIDSQNVYWVNLGPLGADNFPALNSGSVMKVPIGGGTATAIANAQAVPVSILVSGGTVYWSEYGLSAPGLIMSASTSTSAITPLVDGLNDPAALALSNGTLYWTIANSSPTNGAIMSLSAF
jgi:hypothetical protein